jgi:hypothetical protein
MTNTMKRILLLLLFISLYAGTAQSQRLTEVDDHLDKRVLAMELNGSQMAVLELQRELNLSQEQLMQVELLNEERFQRMTEAELNAADPIERQRVFREIHVKLDKVMAGILTEGQLKHYLELEGRQHINFLSGKDDEE